MTTFWVVWLVCGWFVDCLTGLWMVCGWFMGGFASLCVIWLVCFSFVFRLAGLWKICGRFGWFVSGLADLVVSSFTANDLQVHVIKDNWLALSQRVLIWKNYRVTYGSPSALCFWFVRAYSGEKKQLVSCLFCLYFAVIGLWRLP